MLKGTVSGSFEYSQPLFWLRNKKINFQLHTLICGPVKDNMPVLYGKEVRELIFLFLKYFVATQKNHLNEMVLLSTLNIL